MTETEFSMKEAILDEAVTLACFDGWSQSTLRRAAVEAGYSEADADLVFPRGPVDAVLLHSELVDRYMVAEMETLDLQSMSVRDIVAISLRVRLESQIGNREAIRKGLRVMADPRHSLDAARCVGKTVDIVWRLAGDASTDCNYYSKRGLLVGVYSSTLVFWLNDNSESQRRTWEFLNHRIRDVLTVGKTLGRFSKIPAEVPNPFKLFDTARRRWRDGPVFR